MSNSINTVAWWEKGALQGVFGFICRLVDKGLEHLCSEVMRHACMLSVHEADDKEPFVFWIVV